MCAMDTKIGQSRINAEEVSRRAAKRRPFFSFIQDLKAELKKVSWTTKEELLLSTKVVVVATFILGLGIYMIDLIVKSGLDLVAQISRLVFG